VCSSDLIRELEHPRFGAVKTLKRPIWVDGSRDAISLPPPELGEHTDEILRSIGANDDRIQSLRRDGTV